MNAINPNLRICFFSVKFEFTSPISFFFPWGLFFFIQDIIFYYQYVHFGSHEAPIGVFGSTDYRLTTHIEACVDDYSTTCQECSVMEMTARINGTGDDIIHIKETGHLVGEGARGVLTSRIAVRENAKAEVYNDLTASAPYTRGHVDCKEIIQGNGVAKAVPIVQVGHPKAHVTHEAAIGSVDNKQLETLMARGLSEDDAVNLIIEGLLS